jgi:hypothetical protein
MTNDAPDPRPRGGRRSQYRLGQHPNSRAHLFKPGQSGNPGGKPAGFLEVTRLAREQGPASIAKLAELRDDPDTPPQVAAFCCEKLLDRGYGKAVVSVGFPVEMTGEAGPTGEPMTGLLRAARHNDKQQRRRELQAEIDRIDREDRTDREIQETENPAHTARHLLTAVRNEKG